MVRTSHLSLRPLLQDPITLRRKKTKMMNKRIDIPAELYESEVVCFLANRYHTTPKKVVQCFLVQDGLVTEIDEDFATFHLEDNELEILRGLTRGNLLL